MVHNIHRFFSSCFCFKLTIILGGAPSCDGSPHLNPHPHLRSTQGCEPWTFHPETPEGIDAERGSATGVDGVKQIRAVSSSSTGIPQSLCWFMENRNQTWMMTRGTPSYGNIGNPKFFFKIGVPSMYPNSW